MISDSPYDLRESVLSFRQSAAAGALGALAMILILQLLEPPSSALRPGALDIVGDSVAPLCGNFCSGDGRVLSGGVLLIALGILGGILYGIGQQRIPPHRLLIVGLFFGFLLWLADRLLLAPVVGNELGGFFRTWVWLVACLTYGASLATVAAIIEARRPKANAVVQPD